MNNRYILEKQMMHNDDSFVLDLSNIKFIKDINLDLDNNLLQCNKAIESFEFNKAMDYLKVLESISEYGNKEVDKVRNKMNFEMIRFLYSNVEGKDISFYVDILLKIKTFFNLLYSQHNLEMNEELEKMVSDLKDIEKEVSTNICDIITLSFKSEVGAIKKITSVNILIDGIGNIENKLEIEELNKNYENKINNIISTMEKSKLGEIRSLLINTYEEDFLNSKEFIEVITNIDYIKLESYYDLLQLANKSYLIYNFNKSYTFREKMSLLYNNNLSEFLELPVLYKEHIVEEILEKSEDISSVEKFFSTFNNRTNEKKQQMNKNSIPL
ncbi:hypothetical protein KPL28_06930 [Clostridium algidicarnis]|uniref:hypothetical protein n=1 Tax=Clostridium algidicarnis TaxID=37659 RepID=UPI001C0B07A4|nr:hypothetical protein [Clostridium algidicarnis]MBU3209368.1 hypothetical protein [Clostridium algidicarnis]